LVLLGANINQGALLSSFDNLGSITGQNDAVSVAIDNNIFKEGNGSLSFGIKPSLGNGLASILVPLTNDFTSVLQNSGYFKLWVYLPSTALSSFILRLYSSSTDYFAMTATAFDDGTAFSTGLNTWKRVQFAIT
jgi:hypothetical protein